MRTTVFALVVCSLAAPRVVGAAPAEKEVLDALDVWKTAMIKKDKATFEKVLHPDLSYGHSSGVVENKAEAIKHVVDATSSYTAINFIDTKVRVQGKTALVTGKVDYQERVDGKDNLVNLVVLTVWTKGPHGWQMIARQATKPTPPHAAAAAPGAAPKAPAPAAPGAAAKAPAAAAAPGAAPKAPAPAAH